VIICGECGTHNEDGESFCGECGSYLEFGGQRADDGEPVLEEVAPVEGEPFVPFEEPAPEPEPALINTAESLPEPQQPPVDQGPAGPPPMPTSFNDAPLAAEPAVIHTAEPSPEPQQPPVDQGPAGPPPMPTSFNDAPPAASPPAEPAAPVTPPPPVTPPAPPVVTPAPAEAAGGRHSAGIGPSRPVVPPPAKAVPPRAPSRVSKAAPGAARPAIPPVKAAPADIAARAPQKAVKKAPPRKTLPPEDRAPQPGETICGTCGAGNAPGRKFCRRCGTSLADMPVVKLHWWNRVKKEKRGAQAGYRKKVRRGRPRILGKLIPLLIIAIIVAAVIIFWGDIKKIWDKAADKVDKGDPVAALCRESKGTKSAGGNAAANLTDGAANKFWSPAKGKGDSVICTLDTGAKKVRLVRMEVATGASGEKDDLFKATARVSQIKITVTHTDASKAYVTTKDLPDELGFHDFNIGTDNVAEIVIEVEAVTKAGTKPAALGELKFYVRD
jgi:hypothetical protein